jgi:hypothetical protein
MDLRDRRVQTFQRLQEALMEEANYTIQLDQPKMPIILTKATPSTPRVKETSVLMGTHHTLR